MVEDLGPSISTLWFKVILNVGPMLIFWLIDNYYLEFYGTIKGEEWVKDPMNWSDFEFREFNKSPFQRYAMRMVYVHFGMRVF